MWSENVQISLHIYTAWSEPYLFINRTEQNRILLYIQ